MKGPAGDEYWIPLPACLTGYENFHPRKLLDASLAGGRDVVGVRAIENFLRCFAFPAVLGVDGDQDIAVFHFALFVPRLRIQGFRVQPVLRQSANGSASGRAASAARIGPAAISGPTPGIASVPIPTSQPNTPATPPATAPVPRLRATPWCYARARSPRSPARSGNNTDTSSFEKPASFSELTIRVACFLALRNTKYCFCHEYYSEYRNSY